jgi:hypothetical protein
MCGVHPAVPRLQQEEIGCEETLADLEGGQVQEEGLEDLIAAAAAAAAALCFSSSSLQDLIFSAGRDIIIFAAQTKHV